MMGRNLVLMGGLKRGTRDLVSDRRVYGNIRGACGAAVSFLFSHGIVGASASLAGSAFGVGVCDICTFASCGISKLRAFSFLDS
jgi:hypothetical protein